MMQDLGRSYVRYVNDSLMRTGTLWEGRYKSSLVDSEHYVLACYRYIELNPVRAGMVQAAQDHRWSSHGCNGLGRGDPLVTPHATFMALGACADSRRSRYRDLVAEGLDAADLNAIRQHAQCQRALGSERFHVQIEKQLGRRAGIGSPGRPRKKSQ
jgi:putative transposase